MMRPVAQQHVVPVRSAASSFSAARLASLAAVVLAGAALVATAVALAETQAPIYKSALPADHPDIRYADRPVEDRVSRLARDVERGAVRFERAADVGAHLPALLQRLGLSTASQMLVFSKTSLHAAHISPSQPRALYFADDVVAAYVPGAPTIELAAVDPAIGPVFYALSNDTRGQPSIARVTGCLRCHQGPNTAGVPGVYVGSVIPGPTGAPLVGDTAIITDHTTPFRDRWGGWYVTARRGEQPDRANAVASNPSDPGSLVREAQQNLVSLAGRFPLADYLAPTSDIVALMVFEHQTQMTNLMTRVAWEVRISGQAPSLDELIAYMLFSNEAPLVEPIEGVSVFAAEFASRRPRDRRGRSLRELDLRTRLFRYPLSYMIDSAAFAGLPDATRQSIYQRLRTALDTADHPMSAHLSAADRRALVEILRDTHAGFAALATAPPPSAPSLSAPQSGTSHR